MKQRLEERRPLLLKEKKLQPLKRGVEKKRVPPLPRARRKIRKKNSENELEIMLPESF